MSRKISVDGTFYTETITQATTQRGQTANTWETLDTESSDPSQTQATRATAT